MKKRDFPYTAIRDLRGIPTKVYFKSGKRVGGRFRKRKVKLKICQECGAETAKLYPGWIRGAGTEKDREKVCKKCHDKMEAECAAGLSALFG